jgi:hypothetical protein
VVRRQIEGRYVRLRQVEARRGKPRPHLLDEIEKAPGAAADLEMSQFALIAAGKHFVQLRKRLPSRGIDRPVEQYLNLRIIPSRSLLRHPATRLEMEILQIVAGPLPDGVLAQNFAVPTALAAPIDLGQILEEEPGAVEQRQQRSVMIGG